jgi:hypothetical protein
VRDHSASGNHVRIRDSPASRKFASTHELAPARDGQYKPHDVCRHGTLDQSPERGSDGDCGRRIGRGQLHRWTRPLRELIPFFVSVFLIALAIGFWAQNKEKRNKRSKPIETGAR